MIDLGISQWLSRMAGGTQQYGSTVLYSTDSAITNGKFEYIVVNEDCVFATFSTNAGVDLTGARESSGAGGINASGTITKGMILYAPVLNGKTDLITNVDLTSGSIIAYG